MSGKKPDGKPAKETMVPEAPGQDGRTELMPDELENVSGGVQAGNLAKKGSGEFLENRRHHEIKQKDPIPFL